MAAEFSGTNELAACAGTLAIVSAPAADTAPSTTARLCNRNRETNATHQFLRVRARSYKLWVRQSKLARYLAAWVRGNVATVTIGCPTSSQRGTHAAESLRIPWHQARGETDDNYTQRMRYSRPWGHPRKPDADSTACANRRRLPSDAQESVSSPQRKSNRSRATTRAGFGTAAPAGGRLCVTASALCLCGFPETNFHDQTVFRKTFDHFRKTLRAQRSNRCSVPHSVSHPRSQESGVKLTVLLRNS